MASYNLVVHRDFGKEIRRLTKKDVIRILDALENLKTDPRPPSSKKLEGSDDAYRVRIGTYRVLYRIVEQDLVIPLLKMSCRKAAYK